VPLGIAAILWIVIVTSCGVAAEAETGNAINATAQIVPKASRSPRLPTSIPPFETCCYAEDIAASPASKMTPDTDTVCRSTHSFAWQ
jgi:hypothetical protein